MTTSQNAKTKLLDPKIDAIFQILFSKSKLEVIKGLLSAILNMPISDFTNNTVNLDLNTILDRSYPSDKIGVLDVRAQTDNEISSEIFTDKFEIVIIELPKVEQAYLKNKDNLLLQWMMFLLNPESLEVSEIMQENESIKVATKELEEISENEVNQRIAELREKARRDDAALLSTGKRLGREEAQKEMEELKFQIVKKLLLLKIPFEQISEITGINVTEIGNISNHT